MSRSAQKETHNDPDFDECLSKGRVDDLSRCIAQKSGCRHAVPAGVNRLFCQHPRNRMDLPYGFLVKPSGETEKP